MYIWINHKISSDKVIIIMCVYGGGVQEVAYVVSGVSGES